MVDIDILSLIDFIANILDITPRRMFCLKRR